MYKENDILISKETFSKYEYGFHKNYKIVFFENREYVIEYKYSYNNISTHSLSVTKLGNCVLINGAEFKISELEKHFYTKSQFRFKKLKNLKIIS